MRHLTVCADDFGLNPQINAAIVRLVSCGRLNAVSCMATGLAMHQGVEALLEAANTAPHRVDIGLHLTLTEYAPLTDMPTTAPRGRFPSINEAIVRSYTTGLASDEIRTELQRQWDGFHEAFGRRPAFLDGHQHVHVLPGVREALIDLGQRNLPTDGWIRSCHTPAGTVARLRTSIGKSLVLTGLARRLNVMLADVGISSNERFFGISDLKPGSDYGKSMRRWLSAAAQCHSASSLIMCHPGIKNNDRRKSDAHDPIAKRRIEEFAYLESAAFVQDLRDRDLQLSD